MYSKSTKITGGFLFPMNHFLLAAKIMGTPLVKTIQISLKKRMRAMKMFHVLTDNIRRGYSLHESHMSSYMKGAQAHFCLLISIKENRLSVQLPSLPPTTSSAACLPL